MHGNSTHITWTPTQGRARFEEHGPDSLKVWCILVGILYSRHCSIQLRDRLEANNFHRILGGSIAPPNKETLVGVDPALQPAVRTGQSGWNLFHRTLMMRTFMMRTPFFRCCFMLEIG
jgi:hypothetical protein